MDNKAMTGEYGGDASKEAGAPGLEAASYGADSPLVLGVTFQQLSESEDLLTHFNPEWDRAHETLQTLLSNLLGREVILRLSK
jgi:hypothetical protein